MHKIPHFRSLFFGQALNSIGIPFLLGMAILLFGGGTVTAIVVFLSALALVILALLPWEKSVRSIFLLAAVGIALSLAVFGGEIKREGDFSEYHGKSVTAQGVVSYVGENLYDIKLSDPFRGKVRVTGEKVPRMGDKIQLTLSLSSDLSDSEAALGIDLKAQEGSEPVAVGTHFGYSLLGTVREKLFDAFGKDREGGFLRAILLGDRTHLSDEDQAAFRKTASSHLLAISGLHISQFLSTLFCLVQSMGLGTRQRSLLFLPVLFALFFIAGGSVSVFRAVWMAAVPLVGSLFRRRSDSVTALVFAAVILVIWEPYALTSATFLLSFLSTFGILTAALPLCEYLHWRWLDAPGKGKNVLAFLLNSFLIASSAFVFTFPVQLLLFGEISPFAPLYSILLANSFSLVLSVAVYSSLLASIPLVGDFAVKASRFVGRLFLLFQNFLSAGSPGAISFGDLAIPLAFSVLGILAFFLITHRRVTAFLWLHAVLFCLGTALFFAT